MDYFDNLLTYILILNYRQDFQMLSDIGLGEGSFKSRQDSLGCVAALLNQAKVVSVANSKVLQYTFFEVTVTLALAQGVMPSGSTKPKVEVSRKKRD